MLFADFRAGAEKTYMFEPCVNGCVGDADRLIRVSEGEKSADTFFVEESLRILDEADTIVVLAGKYGKTILEIMERDFPGTPMLLMTESEAVVEYPGAITPSCCVLKRPEPTETLEVYTPFYPETRESRDKMSLILPNIYISNEYFPSKKEELVSRNIRRVINVTDSCLNYFPEDFQYLRIPIKDSVGANIKTHFRDAAAFIEEGIKEGGVLVHCSAGISRSPTIVAAYLMIKYGVKSDHALNVLRIRRDVVDVNFGFMCTLMAFEKELKN